jgi:hypothetical protein
MLKNQIKRYNNLIFFEKHGRKLMQILNRRNGLG